MFDCAYYIFAAPTEAPLHVFARQVTSTEALVWWLPVIQVPPHWVDGYQVSPQKHTWIFSRPQQIIANNK